METPVWVVIDGHRIPATLYDDGEVKGSKVYRANSWDALLAQLPPSVAVEVRKHEWRPRTLVGGLPTVPVGRVGINVVFADFNNYTIRRSTEIRLDIHKPRSGIEDVVEAILDKGCAIATNPFVQVGAAAAGQVKIAALAATGCALYQATSSTPVDTVTIEPRGTTSSGTVPAPVPPPATYTSAIAAYDPAIQRYRIAQPVGVNGLGAAYQEVAQATSKPPGATLVSLPEYKKKTGTRPWYKSPVPFVVGGLLAWGGAVYYLRKRRRR